jgi:membrane associated rhomboid family serine protease/Zn-finger nucleic acid-binding protein
MGVVEVDACPRCRGAFVEPRAGAQLCGPWGDVATWEQSGSARSFGLGRLRCPGDGEQLQVWRVDLPGGGRLELDTCPRCRGLWLDATEGMRLQRAATTMGPLPTRIAGTEGFLEGSLNSPPPGQEKTGVGWYLFQLFSSMPLEVHNPKRRTAVVCAGLVLACIGVFFVQLAAAVGGDQGFVHRFGAVGTELVRGQHLVSLVTHLFLHGGVAHLAGNMWMLWTFGDNIEDRIGRARFLTLYLVSGVAALALQLVMTSDLSIPLVGASGAIAGLMGAYLGLFPSAQLYQVLFFIRWKVPAWLYVGLWAGMNALIGWAELNHVVPETHVAWWAHLGGFAVGLTWALSRGRHRFGDGVVS